MTLQTINPNGFGTVVKDRKFNAYNSVIFPNLTKATARFGLLDFASFISIGFANNSAAFAVTQKIKIDVNIINTGYGPGISTISRPIFSTTILGNANYSANYGPTIGFSFYFPINMSALSGVTQIVNGSEATEVLGQKTVFEYPLKSYSNCIDIIVDTNPDAIGVPVRMSSIQIYCDELLSLDVV